MADFVEHHIAAGQHHAHDAAHDVAHKGKAGAGAVTGGLTKKMGPLPVWAWGLIIGVAAYFVYDRVKSAGSSTTGTTADDSTLDSDGTTTGTDPSDAGDDGSNGAVDDGGASSGGTTDPAAGNTDASGDSGGDGSTTLAGELGDLGSIIGLMQGLDPSFGIAATTGTGSGGSNLVASGPGVTTPLNGSTPPPTKATVNHQRKSPVKSPVKSGTRIVGSAGKAVGFGSTVGKGTKNPGAAAAKHTKDKATAAHQNKAAANSKPAAAKPAAAKPAAAKPAGKAAPKNVPARPKAPAPKAPAKAKKK